MERISDKLHSIVVLLDKEDIKTIGTHLKENKNKKLEILFKLMLTSIEKEVRKEDAFKKIYQKPYSKEVDYILRNECRLLYNEIKDFLIQKEVNLELEDNKCFSDYFFMKAIHNKNDKTLFDKEFDNVLNLSVDRLDFMTAFQLCDLHFFAKTVQQIHNFSNLSSSYTVVEKQKEVLGKFFVANKNKVKDRKLKINEILSDKDRQELNVEISSTFNIEDENYITHLSEYFRLSGEASMLVGKEKISCLQKAFYHISLCAEKNKIYERQKKQISFVLASLHYLVQDFEEAEKLFVSLFKEKNEVDSFFVSYLGNYYNCLLQMGKYLEIVDSLVVYKSEIDKTPRIKSYIDGLLTNLYIMTENKEKLRRSLPLSFTDMPDTFSIHYRFCYVILYFLENDLNMAIREVRNLIDVLQYHKVFQEHLVVAKFLYKYVDKSDKKHTIDINKVFSQLKLEMNEFDTICSDNFRLFIPFKWLKRKLDRY